MTAKPKSLDTEEVQKLLNLTPLNEIEKLSVHELGMRVAELNEQIEYITVRMKQMSPKQVARMYILFLEIWNEPIDE